MKNINNIIDAHYNQLEINDFDYYSHFPLKEILSEIKEESNK